MNQIIRLVIVVDAVCWFAFVTRAETEATAIECLKSATFLAPIDSSAHRKYAPDREVDVLHLALEVTPDFKQRTVEGKATIRFKPIARPVEELKLDAVDLEVHSVTATEKIQTYQVTEDRKSTRLNSSHVAISYAVFCLKKKKTFLHYHLILICYLASE